ncbi:acyltransferase family protein [Patescibacteria group bacterium]|nr:acyltransferase family protein [Patescibacteria group bacterium]
MRERSVNVDAIRVVAMMMVIFLHTILNFTIRTDFFATKLWFLLEPVVALSKTCVLLFFMLSGYLVITKHRSIRQNLNKTLIKIVLPLSFFTLVNITYAWFKFPFNDDNFSQFFFEQAKRMATYPSSSMWFLVVLTFLYLLNPLWQLLLDKKEESRLARTLTTGALTFSLVVTFLEYPAGKTGLMFSTGTAWLGYVFFYLYGGLIKNKWINYSNQKINWLLVAFGFIFTVLGDFLTMWQKTNQITFAWNDYTGNYLSIPVTMMAVGIFNLLISIDLSQLKSKALVHLADWSFGIYLIHTYIVALFTDYLGFDFNKLGMNVYVYNILNVLLVLGISTIITFFWKKIPKVKLLIGG